MILFTLSTFILFSNCATQLPEKLYVSKENGKPIKMEIKDTNQNIIIYIIYI